MGCYYVIGRIWCKCDKAIDFDIYVYIHYRSILKLIRWIPGVYYAAKYFHLYIIVSANTEVTVVMNGSIASSSLPVRKEAFARNKYIVQS